MESHPLANAVRLMTPGEFAAIKLSIKRHGLQVPIVRFEGKILDGRNRYRACEELGRPLAPQDVKDFTGTQEQAAVLVESLNLDRRDLSPEEKRDARAALVQEMRRQGMSIPAITDVTRIPRSTVERDIKRQVSHRGKPAPSTPDRSPPDAPQDPEHASRPRADGGPGTPRPNPPAARAGGEAIDTARVGRVPHTPHTTPATPAPHPPRSPERVTGRDGKTYPARKPERAQCDDTEARRTRQLWTAFKSQLSKMSILATTIVKPQEVKPWHAIDLLETAARTLLRAANRLRKASKL